MNTKSKKLTVKGIISICLIVIVLFAVFMGLLEVMGHIEKYSPTARKTLISELNEGDVTALNYFMTNYVEEGVYLEGTDDPLLYISIAYNLSYDGVWDEFMHSDYVDVIEYYNGEFREK